MGGARVLAALAFLMLASHAAEGQEDAERNGTDEDAAEPTPDEAVDGEESGRPWWENTTLLIVLAALLVILVALVVSLARRAP